ncbi:hypothetical protein IM40_10365 (plasmid) [Candidatus Paracaedimonas acanthamoebae]|nr:hypothetical protein IM40_10365 [Candidatus Paracaedimonas acanthamoebae]
MESLGVVKGKNCSCAQAVNYDGSVIVGFVDNFNINKFIPGGYETNHKRAFRWTAERVIELIENLLVRPRIDCTYIDEYSSGNILTQYKNAFLNRLKIMLWGMNQETLLPPRWILDEVTAITPSGVVLVGQGEYEGQVRAWRAIIPRGNLF